MVLKDGPRVDTQTSAPAAKPSAPAQPGFWTRFARGAYWKLSDDRNDYNRMRAQHPGMLGAEDLHGGSMRFLRWSLRNNGGVGTRPGNQS